MWTQGWDWVNRAIALDAQAYLDIVRADQGLVIALAIVLLAGISQTLGQCIVLFVNRVRPARFILSVVMSALLFLCTFLLWGCSIVGIGAFGFGFAWNFEATFRVLGLSYAPQILGIFVALPHLGLPISVVLSIWSLLTLTVGIAGLQEFGNFALWQAGLCTGLGWLLLQVLQRTVGRPVVAFGQGLLNWAAGTTVVRDRQRLRELIQEGRPHSLGAAPETPAESRDAPIPLWMNEVAKPPPSRSPHWLVWFGVGLGLFVLGGAVVTAQQLDVALWYATLDRTLRVSLDLAGIGLLAVGIAIVLTPLEALGWWAGWYGDTTVTYHGEQVEDIPADHRTDRYVLYLDGINQGSYSYLPEVEQFLYDLAVALPDNIRVIQGIMPYSVQNRPLHEGAPLAVVWRAIDSLTASHPTNPIAAFINLRNVVAVAVSADPRYGPIQNQGLAQVLYDSLCHHGYVRQSGTPITLIGHSGGGQMAMGAASYLRRTLNAAVEVISIGGVISGNVGAMSVQRLFHLVGDRDLVEKLGPIMFADRWPVALLSEWNRAKRRGRITCISLGDVGHNGEAGPFGTAGTLADGRSYLQQTIDLVTGILLKDWTLTGLDQKDFIQPSNYERYLAADWLHPTHYPPVLPAAAEWGDRLQPVGDWVGRLILPSPAERTDPRFVWFEVYLAPPEQAALQGQRVRLTWSPDSKIADYVQLVTSDVNFVDQAEISIRQGNVHPQRLNHWQKVDPLESLAGAHPVDDVVVKLLDPVSVSAAPEPTLHIMAEPVQVTGRYCLLAQILAVAGDRGRIQLYDSASQTFDGAELEVVMPAVTPDRGGVMPSTTAGLDESPANAQGWYLYGAVDAEGQFVVQAIAPRSLFQLQADQVIRGLDQTLHYINYEYWKDVVAQKGTYARTLLCPQDDATAVNETPMQLGDRLLLMHVYGGIGGKKSEFAPMGLFFGHFAYGLANVILDSVTQTPRFELSYRQIYTHNTDGIISGTLDWTRYLGDRQFGWLGTRPVSDILLKFPPLTEDYDFDGVTFSPLSVLLRELDVMAARYRIGDGTGTTFVSPVNSCVQDASQALYTALQRMIAQIELTPLIMKWLREHPDHPQTRRFRQLVSLVKTLERTLTPLGIVRPDWQGQKPTLGGFPIETPMQTILFTLSSWRSLLPRLANDLIVMVFLQLGATVWVLRTNQVGGYDPDIEPIAPTDFSSQVPKIRQIRGLQP